MPAGIFSLTQDQMEAIAPLVNASMSRTVCNPTADLTSTK
jgi:hypothetical protein